MTLQDTLLEATTMSFWKNKCKAHASTHSTGLPGPPCLSPFQICLPRTLQGAAVWGNLCGATCSFLTRGDRGLEWSP